MVKQSEIVFACSSGSGGDGDYVVVVLCFVDHTSLYNLANKSS